jgi:hypothetical protein
MNPFKGYHTTTTTNTNININIITIIMIITDSQSRTCGDKPAYEEPTNETKPNEANARLTCRIQPEHQNAILSLPADQTVKEWEQGRHDAAHDDLF